jgi:hypothetical protein
MAYPSTFLDLQWLVVKKLRLDADPAAGTGPDLQLVKDWLNQIYIEVCETTEATQTAGTATLVAGASSYLLPFQIIRMKQVVVRSAGGQGDSPPLTETSLDDILRRRQSSGAVSATGGSPTHYALVNLSELEFWPTPSTADGLIFYYVAQPVALSAATDVPLIYEPYATRILSYGALAEAADYLREPGEANYRQLYQYWEGRFRQSLNRRKGGHTKQFLPTGTYYPSNPSVDVRDGIPAYT